MIRLVPEVGVEEFFALWLGRVLTRRFQGDKHRIDLAKDPGVVVFEHPALLGLVVGVEDSETLSGSAGSLFFSPNTVVVTSILYAVVVQVIGIDDEGLSFSKEDPAERSTGLSLHIRVKHVRDVEVPCGHEVADVTVSSKHFAFSVECA